MTRGSRVAWRLALAGLLLTTSGGCARSASDDGFMGNTNWLGACDEGSECGDGAMCACGVCTHACDADADCGHGERTASCVPADSHDACAQAPTAELCLAGCEETGDCPDGTTCEDGTCVGAAAGGGDALALAFDGEAVSVSDAYRACESHEDCASVETSCSRCCRPEAIATSLQTAYQARFEAACRDYEGGICQCIGADTHPRCIEGTCTMVPRTDVEDCYAPGQNLADVGGERAVGCLCDHDGAAICSSPLSVACQPVGGADHLAWQVAEEGLCEAPQPEGRCPDGELTDDAVRCAATFKQCYQFPDGRFCGQNPLPSDPFALTREDDLVSIPPAYGPCESHGDCVAVPITCSDCCGYDAIARANRGTYDDRFPDVCSDYMGGVCDCAASDIVSQCVDGACAMVLRDEIGDCYSPTRNLDLAYLDGAVGCNCDKQGAGVCVGSTALVCERPPLLGASALAWQAVEDGPCAGPIPEPDCADGTISDTAEGCLAEFNHCYELADGRFCGDEV